MMDGLEKRMFACEKTLLIKHWRPLKIAILPCTFIQATAASRTSSTLEEHSTVASFEISEKTSKYRRARNVAMTAWENVLAGSSREATQALMSS